MHIQNTVVNNSRQAQKNALLLGCFLSLTQISSILTTFVHIPNVSVVVSIGVLILAFAINKVISINKKSRIAYFILLCVLIVSLFLNGYAYVRQYLFFYLAFATTSLFLTSLKTDYKYLLIVLLRINFLYVIIFFLSIRNSFAYSNNYGVEQMGIAYSMVPGILISFLYFIRQIKTKVCDINLLLSLLVFAGSMYVLMFYTITRGAFVAIGITLILLCYLNSSGKSRSAIIVVLCFIIFLFLFFSVQIINSLMNSFQDSAIGAFNKLFKFVESGDVSNGRDILYQNAIKIIKDSPFCGHGVGFFEQKNSSQYVHQFFLQLLCEVGFLGAFLFLLPLCRFFIKIVRSSQQNTFKSIYIVYFGSIISMLMYSNSFWLVPNFWFIYFAIWNSKSCLNEVQY